MIQENSSVLFVNSILHPSDFSEASKSAFAHALAIAVMRQAQFTILHVGKKGYAGFEWTEFPSVRHTLENWGVLAQGSPQSAVHEQLGVTVKKIDLESESPMAAIISYLAHYPTDLIVLSTAGRKGLPSWIKPSLAENVAHKTNTMTLFVPQNAHGIISLDDGSISLKRILIPIDHEPVPHAAIVYATRAAKLFGEDPVEIILLHIDQSNDMPKLELSEDPAYTFKQDHRHGKVVDEILKAATAYTPDLVVMTTAGRHGYLDALRGSTTDQVLRSVGTPVLAVPAGR